MGSEARAVPLRSGKANKLISGIVNVEDVTAKAVLLNKEVIPGFWFAIKLIEFMDDVLSVVVDIISF